MSHEFPKILTFESAAGAGGAVQEVMAVAGIKATDTILSVTQRVQGANRTAVVGYSGLADNSLTIEYSADPGAGSIVRVQVQR